MSNAIQLTGVKPEHISPEEDDLHVAAIEYDMAFSSTDPKAMSDRREAAHRALCVAARRYGRRVFAEFRR